MMHKNKGQHIGKAPFLHLFHTTNVVSGFRATGIYPVNRQALLEPISAATALTEESGLAYILLYSPLVQCTKSFICEPDMNTLTDMNSMEFEFSEEELDLFEEWFEEGTEVTDDGRYNAWLARFYPTSPPASRVWMRDFQSTCVSKFLSYPTPPSKIPTLNPKACGRVLTSHENILIVKEKRKAKEEKEREEEQKRAREEKARMKAMNKGKS